MLVEELVAENIQVVAGGGAVEAALSVYLENLATTLGSREQLAIAEFAEALLIIPKVCKNQSVMPTSRCLYQQLVLSDSQVYCCHGCSSLRSL